MAPQIAECHCIAPIAHSITRIWAQTLYKILRELGLVQLQSEHSVFTNIREIEGKRHEYQSQTGKTESDFLGYFVAQELIIAVYIDDLLIIGKTREAVKQFKDCLSKRVSMKDEDDAGTMDYLGIEITRDREKGTLRLSQKAYLEGVLKKIRPG